ncbi:DUF1993 domain-containing protein [Pseudogulbenkiania ferrooxidans]|uniref:DUF1993 domain-containing protein n=1 Tax=Pseudogulbenkiania ferrooxidans 2002 TaxID=279714 RepID=B9Z1T9_9NEIS|nr:DUF1993 domain-containing protein [Pseudogulbenkiania ferrooxidans]EEG09384.1 conserved hypothetical protein [Pseudogulbenkiania ferrooxidans 2002]
MSLSMYQASIPVLIRGITNLAAILDKAAAHAAAKNIAPEVLLNARLAPDMFPLVRQVQSVSDTAKGCGARLAGVEVPSFADTETSFAELGERLAKTVAFLQTLTPEQVDGSEERPITLKVRSQEIHFTGQTYLLGFALPNFYFHFTTAYGILRHNGVDIGKADYLGSV